MSVRLNKEGQVVITCREHTNTIADRARSTTG